MRITESTLRQIIRESIDEMSSQTPVQDSNYPQEEEDEYNREEVPESPSSEEKYFGFSLEALGEKITKAFKLWNPSNPVIYRKWTQSEFISNIVNDPKFKLLGEGSYRIVFSFGDDYVVKVAAIEYYFKQAVLMNKEDAMLGRMPKYSSLFPKVYEVDADYKWIIVERCDAISTEEEFLEFFPNPLMDPRLHIEDSVKMFFDVLGYCVYRTTGNTVAMGENAAHIARWLTPDPALPDFLQKDQGVSFEQIIRSYEKIKLFNKIVDFCAEFGARPDEIRKENVGISPDGRFVIIDSSIEKTLAIETDYQDRFSL